MNRVLRAGFEGADPGKDLEIGPGNAARIGREQREQR
jgi:hypothetical protein